MQSVAMQPAQDFDQAFVDTVIAERASRPGALLGILHKVQEHQPGHYLPTAVLEYIAAKTATPLSRVYSVVTFYALFSRAAGPQHRLHLPRHRLPHAVRAICWRRR